MKFDFSVSSGCFLFLNLLLSFIWLCEEAQCVSILAVSQICIFFLLLFEYSCLHFSSLLHFDPVIPLLGIHLKEPKILI